MTDSNTEPVLSAAGRPLPKRWLAVIATIWAGQAVSMVTSYAAGYAAVWYVTETTGSALALSLMTIFAMLPTGLLSPFGGVIADRFSRKTVMIISDLGVGVVSLALGFLILAGDVSLALIALFAAARSIGQAFHSPAMMATLPLLVPDKHLMRINTLDQLLMSIVSIGAPAFGILLYTTIGFHSVMFLDFFGALCAVAGLMLAKIPNVRDEEAANQHVLANLRDGWRALTAKRGLLMVMAAVTLGTMIFSPMSAVYPLMTYSHFGGDGFMASIAEATWGIGMIVGSGIIMAWGGGKRLALLMAVACILTGIITRKREMAVLQSIGMTGKQLKTMLVCEGLLYALSSVLLSLVLAVVLGPLAFSALQSMFWFFTYRFTLAPILAVAPVFALLGALVPLAVYRSISKHTVVERLRESDN